jgi:hypothetical protein
MNTSTQETHPNYRIYDRTGGGVTQDIHATSLEDAIEQGREWIEAGDWTGCSDDDGGDTYRTIELECVVREIVRTDVASAAIDIEAALISVGILWAKASGEAARMDLSNGSRVIGTGVSDTVTEEQVEELLAEWSDFVSDIRIDDSDGSAYLAVTLVSGHGEIDEQATRDGQSHDCSGTYSDPQPECDGDGGGAHDWRTPHGLVGGLVENPGFWSGGGTRTISTSVCRLCGQYKTEINPGSQRNPGEPSETVTIRQRDEASDAWLRSKHDEDGFLPAWLAEMLDCSMSTRMTKADAAEFVRANDDDSVLDDDDIEHAFAATFGRRSTDKDRAEGLWSHLNA